MNDGLNEVLQHLLTLSPEEAAEAVKAMSPEARLILAGGVCASVRQLSESIVENSEEIWDNR